MRGTSVANSLWPKIGKMGVQKTAKNRPHFKTTFRHFLTPSTIFIAFLCDNFFWKIKNHWIFLKKVFGFMKVKISKTFWWKLKMTKSFHLKKVTFLLYRNWQKWQNWSKNWSKKGHFQIWPQNRLKLAISRPKIGSRFYLNSHRLTDLKNRQFADLSAELATLPTQKYFCMHELDEHV